MNRRSFLAIAGSSLLAGCTTQLNTEQSNSTTTEQTPSLTETTTESDQSDSPFGSLPLVELETGPRAVSASTPYVRRGGPGVSVEFASTATADHPATVRATLRNHNDWKDTFRLSDVPGFHDVNSTRLRPSGFDRHFEDDSGLDRPESTLYLAPTENHDLVDEESPKERGPDGYWRATEVPTKLPSTVTLDAGESISGEYHVLGHWERTGFPTGSYSFGYSDDALVLNVWNTDQPGPDNSWEFERSVPSLADERDTPWFHDATSESTVYLEPSADRAEPPAELAFRLVNHSREPLSGNPYDWGLYKLAGGEWHLVEPWAIPMPASAVSPGDSYNYLLYAFHGEGFDVGNCDADRAVTVDRLGGGTYAFQSGFSANERAEPAAIFEFDAPALDVSYTDDATVNEDGDRVTVTLPEWDDDEHPANATLAVEPAYDATTDESYVAEQVVRRRFRALQNALAAIADAKRVTVRADKHAVENVVGYDRETMTFSYDGATYRAAKRVDS